MTTKERKEQMVLLRKKGRTFQEIATKFSISRERVRQIIHNIRRPGSPPHKIILYRRITCLICHTRLGAEKGEHKYCNSCTAKYRLDKKGRDKIRALVRARDANTCQACGQEGSKGVKSLDVHHLNGLCGKRSRAYDRITDMHILITVCHKCHYNLHDHAQHGVHKQI
jgi:hypothetical protein